MYCFSEGYQAGPAELLHDGKRTGVRDFPVDFDSGTTLTLFITEAYQAVLDKVCRKIGYFYFVET